MKNLVFVALALTFLCSFKSPTMQNGEFPLYGTKWFLTQMNTAGSTQEITLRKAFIKFDEEKMRAGGNGSCNSFGGQLSVVRDSLHIDNIFSTKMYCESVQKTEDMFFNLLGKVNRFEIKDNKLSLYFNKDLLLQFVASPTP